MRKTAPEQDSLPPSVRGLRILVFTLLGLGIVAFMAIIFLAFRLVTNIETSQSEKSVHQIDLNLPSNLTLPENMYSIAFLDDGHLLLVYEDDGYAYRIVDATGQLVREGKLD